jgi:hypothetical protein
MMRGSTAAADSAALAWQQEQRQGGGALAEARAEAAAALEAGRKDLVKALILGSGICRCDLGGGGRCVLVCCRCCSSDAWRLGLRHAGSPGCTLL